MYGQGHLIASKRRFQSESAKNAKVTSLSGSPGGLLITHILSNGSGLGLFILASVFSFLVPLLCEQCGLSWSSHVALAL